MTTIRVPTFARLLPLHHFPAKAPRAKSEIRMSIRTRLTLWYTAVLTIFIIVLGTFVYVVLAFNLTAGLDRTLRDTANRVISTSRVRSFLDIPVIAMPELDVFGSNVYIEVINNDDQVVRASANLRGFTGTLDEVGLRGGESAHQPVTHDVRTGGASLRVLTVPLMVGDQIAGYLQVAAVREQVDNALDLLLIVLAIGGLGAIVASAIVGRLLAGRALRPIDMITQTAFAISRADDLDKRIPQVGPQDEVGRLAKTFNVMLDRLESLFRGQQRFIADISHELRTPLTTIRGNVDLMRRMKCFDEPSLNAIQAESDRMMRLVGDLLLLAQADAGQPIRRERVELDTVMLEVYRQMRPIAQGVELIIGEEDQAVILGDADRIKQLIINLLGNAIKYTPKGGQVSLGLHCSDDMAVLTVTDTGIGIPAEDVPHIFERFYRVDKARSRAAGGTGLGLSIVQWIVQAHGGRIDVQSQVGKGTTFAVRLPLAQSML